MAFRAKPVPLEDVRSWRELYRSQMRCQIIHDSIHDRPGWSQEYVLFDGSVEVGYGSVAVAGPWSDTPTVYEFYIHPNHHLHTFEFFAAFLEASGALMIEMQSNDPLAAVIVHAFARDVASQSILFRDMLRTRHAPDGAVFRPPLPDEVPDVSEDQLHWHGVVEVEGTVAAFGGVLFHYNPPYGDIHMEVAEPFRRRGFGSFLVQELKRICYAGGHVPAARCNPANLASRRTLQKAGFVPCGHILSGHVAGPADPTRGSSSSTR